MDLFEHKRMIEDGIITVLKTIYDPELPVNIYDLGLIYGIVIPDDFNVKIRMTLTAPNCPVAEELPLEVKERVQAVSGVRSAEVEIVFDPPWSREMISEAALLELGLL
jgi:FeS assembly SUF system protein